jgi:hypothetical protein
MDKHWLAVAIVFFIAEEVVFVVWYGFAVAY